MGGVRGSAVLFQVEAHLRGLVGGDQQSPIASQPTTQDTSASLHKHVPTPLREEKKARPRFLKMAPQELAVGNKAA